jgi:hypothetical protein
MPFLKGNLVLAQQLLSLLSNAALRAKQMGIRYVATMAKDGTHRE